MNIRHLLSKLLTPFVVVALTCGVAAFSNTAEAKKLPEESPEGLKLVPKTKLSAVYMREGADFTSYDKVAILDCYVAFRKNWQRDQNSSLQPFKVKDEDVTRIKNEMADGLKKVFSKELTDKGTAVVTEAGTGVLILRPAIINLDINAPDTMQPGRTRSFATSAGEATLFLEVFDGVTGELLARVIDTEEMDQSSMRMRNSVTNSMDVDRMLKGWAETLAKYLQQARSSGAPVPSNSSAIPPK